MTGALIAVGLTFSVAKAQSTVTDEMPVTIEILDACEITATPTTLDFGQHGVLTSIIDSTSTIEVTCTTLLAYNIGLDGGLNGPGILADRRMNNGTDFVEYELYQDASHNTEWGDTINVDTQASIGTGVAQDFTVYGSVPVQTTPPDDFCLAVCWLRGCWRFVV